MQDNQNKNDRFSPNSEGQAQNHQIGRELYNRGQQKNQEHNPQHRPEDHKWDSRNNFHTGHSNQQQSHFPEDSHQRSTNADRGASLSKHYGNREHSTYRDHNSLNYGDGHGNSSRSHEQRNQSSGNSSRSHEQRNESSGNSQNRYSSHGDGRGNYSAQQDSYGRGHDNVHSQGRIPEQRRRDDSNENYYRGAYMDSRGVEKEKPSPESNPYTEYPGTRSRYKDDDYRYGSGNHDWYQEQRYTDNSGNRQDRDKGSMLGDMGEGVREAWNDMTNGVRNMFNSNSDRDRDRHDQDRSRQNQNNRRPDQQSGNHDYEYRSRRDQGVEKGPRWSDETDSGDDSFFYSRDNNPRYY